MFKAEAFDLLIKLSWLRKIVQYSINCNMMAGTGWHYVMQWQQQQYEIRETRLENFIKDIPKRGTSVLSL